MKVLVTGASGQLGYDVCKELKNRNVDVIKTYKDSFDLINEVETINYISNKKPDVIVHCAAYTAVDKAEDEKEKCFAVNYNGTENIAKAAKQADAKLVYISTDYVFNGEGDLPFEVYNETSPLNVYGMSKLKGENAVKENCDKYFIVRTSWVFGINNSNFVKTIIRLCEDRDEISVVSDQIGSPTYTFDLAKLICDMIFTKNYGTYHATNEGFCSFADFAKQIVAEIGKNTNVKYISTEEYPVKAVRPKNSRLSKENLTQNGFKKLPCWKDALSRFVKELNQN